MTAIREVISVLKGLDCFKLSQELGCSSLIRKLAVLELGFLTGLKSTVVSSGFCGGINIQTADSGIWFASPLEYRAGLGIAA